jgi:hypothetical protein
MFAAWSRLNRAHFRRLQRTLRLGFDALRAGGLLRLTSEDGRP